MSAALEGTVRWACRVAVLFALLGPASAAAHPIVEEARRLVDQADFAAAEQAFGRAEAATDLTRADVVALLEGRALLHQALGDTAAVEADLARLAALDPGHAFGPGLPPELSETFLRVRTRAAGPLRLRIDARPAPGGLSVRAIAENDPGGLVRAVELHARAGLEPWRTGAEELVVVAAPGARVQVWASARGPGGAVVAERGSTTAPDETVVPGAATLATPASGATETHGGSGRTWLWVGIGAIAVAAVATGVVLLLTMRSDETVIDAPELRGM